MPPQAARVAGRVTSGLGHPRAVNVRESDTVGRRWAFLRAAHDAGAGRGVANPNGEFRVRRGRSADGLHHTGGDNCTTVYGQKKTFSTIRKRLPKEPLLIDSKLTRLSYVLSYNLVADPEYRRKNVDPDRHPCTEPDHCEHISQCGCMSHD